MNSRSSTLAALLLAVASVARAATDISLPHFETRHGARQLIVNGEPFLILGGELFNSSSSSRAHMQPVWEKLATMHLNTVLAAVSWELIEPQEGQFNFELVDGLIEDARAHQLHLVLLWFGSWKNGMSSYAPVWVKRDTVRFPRAQLAGGETPEVLSPLAATTAEADARAFAALLRHLREIDGRQHTVLMVQVENEVGLLGSSRDRSPAAQAAFAGPVPAELLAYLQEHSADLVPELRAQWAGAGARTSGSWSEVFGAGPATDELFMAWHYARFIDRVAIAGAAQYPLPFFANAWLPRVRDRLPGDYPSGGPVAHLLNIWQAGAPHLALLAPDIYSGSFEDRCRLFTRCGNPLFIPETLRGEEVGRNLFLAVGAYRAVGFSPFGIDTFAPPSAEGAVSAGTGDSSALIQSYAVLEQIAPLVLAHQGRETLSGFVLDADHPPFSVNLGGVIAEIGFDRIFGVASTKGFGVIIALGPQEFIGAGTGFRVVFKPAPGDERGVGIGSIDEGVFHKGQWIRGRRLNGDENDQGRAWRFSFSEPPKIERCTIYRY